MARVTVYGASDDLVEVEGDIREEFNPGFDNDDGSALVFSDGTALKIVYTKEGVWRITPLAKGSASFEKTEGVDADSEYSDRVTLVGDIRWCVFAPEFKFEKAK